MPDLGKILTAKYPDAAWELENNDYDRLVWIGPGNKPTLAELELHWPQVEFDLIAKQKETAIDGYIETVAADRGYGRKGVAPSVACSGYAGYSNSYQAEAQAYIAWMASLWPVCWQIMQEVADGQRPIPTDQELLAALPPMVWPT